MIEPLIHFSEGLGTQGAAMDSAVNRLFNQSCAFENLEMFGHTGQRLIEWLSELGYYGRSTGQAGEESPSGSVGKSLEDLIELIVTRSILGHGTRQFKMNCA